MPDQAYACTGCSERAGEQLARIVDMVPAARDVAHGQARHGSSGGGGFEARLPLNLGATQRLDAIQNALTTWARHIAAERQGATWVFMNDAVLEAALWLGGSGGHLEWIRHRPEADEFLADVAAAARVITGIVRGPAAQRYLGPCGAPTESWEAESVSTDGPGTEACDGDVYGRQGASTGTCRTCKAEVAQAERRAWLDGEVRARAFRASEVAEAYGVNVNTIRSWAARGQLRSYWRTTAGLTVEWADPPLDDTLTGEALKQRLGEISDEIRDRGGRLHYVGDVLDLAAADAARRAEEQAKRARRAAAKAAADTEGDAA
jgi:hypothetical protein